MLFQPQVLLVILLPPLVLGQPRAHASEQPKAVLPTQAFNFGKVVQDIKDGRACSMQARRFSACSPYGTTAPNALSASTTNSESISCMGNPVPTNTNPNNLPLIRRRRS
jgi:hypothetical protein